MINYSISWTSRADNSTGAVPDALAEGLAKHLQGALEEAVSAYLRALRERPDRVLACYNLAVALIDSGCGVSSIPLLKRVLRQRPGSQVFRGALLYGLAHSGRLTEARQLLSEAEPLGMPVDVLGQWGAWLDDRELNPKSARGLETLAPRPASLAHEPTDAPLEMPAGSAVHARLQDPFARAMQAYQSGQFESLVEGLRPSLVEFPSWGEGHHLSGLGWMALKRPDLAVVSLERAAELMPGRAEVWDHLGVVYARLDRAGDVTKAFEGSLVLNPLRAETWNNAADAALTLGDLERAFQFALQAVRLNPDLPQAGYCLLQSGYKLESAACGSEVEVSEDSGVLATAVRALKANADSPDRAMAIAPMLAEIGLFRAAKEILEQSLLTSGNRPADLLGQLIWNQRRTCDWRAFAERESELCALARASDEPVVEPFIAMSISCFRPEDLLRIARQHARERYDAWCGRGGALKTSIRRSSNERLRIGYLSGDFQDHATAYLTASVFERHDRAQFEIFAYSTGADDGGAMRRRLEAAFDRFVDIRSASHLEAAQRIRDDGIDILVDLKGYTKNGRLEILALRPSPIQATWLGFPGGLGASFVDYLIADPVVIPDGQALHYDEAIAYLPGAYAPVDDSRLAADPPARAEAGLPQEGFVFCCFNDPYKITPEIFDCWCRVLQEVPESVLWLYARTAAVRDNLLSEAAARGVAPERLIFAARLPQHEHLARLRCADVFLDTRPVNAHTTASDALWMGVPVLTCPGDTFASRVAASLLTAVGLPELIARDLGEYQSLAVELAAKRDYLSDLRTRLEAARGKPGLFDSQSFARNLEALYLRMWARYRRGDAPGCLDPAPASGRGNGSRF